MSGTIDYGIATGHAAKRMVAMKAVAIMLKAPVSSWLDRAVSIARDVGVDPANMDLGTVPIHVASSLVDKALQRGVLDRLVSRLAELEATP